MEAVIAAFIAAAASIACQLIIARSGAKENKKITGSHRTAYYI
ncbi:hypothetical protein [Ruminococcus bicirculans (ex Wegman et al. 2014)]